MANAIKIGLYSVICICETWLNENISNSELLLAEYNIYRADRAHQSSNTHGGALIAIKNSQHAPKIKLDVECCVLYNITLANETIYICSFYNPPRASQYRYDYQCFNKILEAIPKKSKAVICGDINFPSTNWDIFSSQENDEQEILEMFEDRLLQQSINFSTCGTNTLDVFLYQNCQVYSEHDENFDKIYDCSDHIAIRTAIELEHFDPPPAVTNFYSFGSGDYDRIVGAMKDRPFNPQCYTNVDNMYNYLTDLIDTHIPKRTKYRQSLPPWITPGTSHQMKTLNTQKRLLE